MNIEQEWKELQKRSRMVRLADDCRKAIQESLDTEQTVTVRIDGSISDDDMHDLFRSCWQWDWSYNEHASHLEVFSIGKHTWRLILRWD